MSINLTIGNIQIPWKPKTTKVYSRKNSSNSPILSKLIEFVVKIFPTQETPEPDGFPKKFFQIFKYNNNSNTV